MLLGNPELHSVLRTGIFREAAKILKRSPAPFLTVNLLYNNTNWITNESELLLGAHLTPTRYSDGESVIGSACTVSGESRLEFLVRKLVLIDAE